MDEGTKIGIRGKILRRAAIAALVAGPLVMAGCGLPGGDICENPHPIDPTKCNDPNN